jgi:hypothetical protein
MSSESVSSVEAPPAASEQTRAAPESVDNISSAQLRARFLQQETAQAPATTPAPAEDVAPVAPAATEADTTTNQPAEVTAPAETETTEQPAAETQPESTEAAEQSDDVLSQLSSLDPKAKQLVDKVLADYKAKQQAVIDKRIAKERAKRGDAEREAQQLKTQLLSQTQQAPQPAAIPPTPPMAGVPLSHINSPQELVKLQQEAKETIRFVERTLDREDIDQGVQIGDRVFTKKDLKERMWQAKEVLEDQIPQRAAFLQQREQAVASAYERFPFYKDQSSPEFARAQAIIRQAPAIMNTPNALEIVGKLVLGEMALEGKVPAAKAAPAAKPKPKPASDQTMVGAAPGSIARVSPDTRSAAALAAEREKMAGGGNVSSAQLRQYLQKADQLRNSR